MRKSESGKGGKDFQMWRLGISEKREIELDIGLGWTDRSRAERRKDHMETRKGGREQSHGESVQEDDDGGGK